MRLRLTNVKIMRGTEGVLVEVSVQLTTRDEEVEQCSTL
jgi:hypothetical protein